jgi:hypothetical protein
MSTTGVTDRAVQALIQAINVGETRSSRCSPTTPP